MDIYLGFVGACLLSLVNASQFTTQTPKFQNCGFNMSATCDDVMWLFADGDLLVGNSSDWRVTSEVHIPANTKVIEIHCLDSWIHGGILASSDNGLITDGAWNCSSDNRTTWNPAFLLGRNRRTAPAISPEAIWIWTDMSHWMQTDHRRHTKAICKIELETSQCPETCPPFSEPVRTTTPIPTTTSTVRTTTPSKPKPGFNLTATCDNSMKLFVDGNLKGTSSNWRDTSQIIIPENTESIEIHCMTSGIVGGILASSNNGLLTDGAWNCSSDNGATWNSAYEVGPNGGAVPNISPEAEWIWTTGCIGDWTYKYTGKKHKRNVICKIDLKPVIDGGWSALSNFSTCSATCGDATKWQSRTCSNPLPSNGGEPCHGLDEVVVSCGLTPCGGHSCPYTDKFTDCPKWKNHCKSGEWTACMNQDCPKTCKCLTLHATCDNNMKIFADTKLLITDNDWKKTSEVEIPENTNGIEIHCYDLHVVGGILASFSNGLKTDWTWSCSADGGSTWNPAYEIGANGMSPWGVRPQISTEAKWIWTGKDTYHGKHKNVTCKISLDISSKTATIATTATTTTGDNCPKEKGFCVLPNGGDQNSGVIKLDSVDGNTIDQQAQCLSRCRAYKDATGCEVIWHQGNRGCYVHTHQVARGNNVDRHACWIFSKCKGISTKTSTIATAATTTTIATTTTTTITTKTGSSCGVTLCSSTEGCPLVKNKLLTTLPQLNKQFLVSFEFLATEFINGWQNVIHFTEQGDCCDVGRRVPAFWVLHSGQLYPRFAVNGNGDYGILTPHTKKYSVNEWHKVEFSQKLENNKYIYKVIIDGVKLIEVENKQPKIFSIVKVFAADPWYNTLKGSLKNLFINTEGSNTCKGAVNDCYEKNINYPHNDMNNGGKTEASSALECQKLCQSTDGCILFSWVSLDVPDGPLVGRGGECWLKHTKANRGTQKYVISGPKQCGQQRRAAFSLRSWTKQKNEKTSNVSSLPGQTGLKLQFQLKGKTGTEKVKVSVDDNEEEFDLKPEWRLFSYPRPSSGSFSVEFLNDIGYTDVFIRGHESQVTDLLPNFPANKFLGCGTKNEDEKCGLLRKGTLMWNGKYTYTLKGQ